MTSGTAIISAREAWSQAGTLTIHDAPDGVDAMAVCDAAAHHEGIILYVARDAARANAMREALQFFAPDIPTLDYPAWDCLPYDRVSPSSAVSSQRMATLAMMSAHKQNDGPLIIVTAINAILQRTPPRDVIASAAFGAKPGSDVDMDSLMGYLAANGYTRASTVREPGEFAVRGGLMDIFPPGADEPIRLDFFGDSLESIRAFDAATQRTTRQLKRVDLAAASEVLLTPDAISRFRTAYVATFGPAGDDPVYEAVSAGRNHAGMEHWLPLFYETTDTLFDFADEALIITEHLSAEAGEERLSSIQDYYAARAEDLQMAQPKGKDNAFAAPAYRPLPPEALYLTTEDFAGRLQTAKVRTLSPFSAAEGRRAFSMQGRVGRSFAAERAAEKLNVFDAVKIHIDDQRAGGRKAIIACWSEGSADRMRSVLGDHGLGSIDHVTTMAAIDRTRDTPCTAVLGLETGFEVPGLVFISEQDILGDRLVRKTRRKRADNFLTEAASLSVSDLVVHVEHGIGRYDGLETLEVQGAPHDCLLLVYAGGDKLYLPVENIDLLSRYGSDTSETGNDSQLDRLGGAAWQARKSKMKARIRMLAEQLIKIAAQRAMKKAAAIMPPEGAYDEFCARFPYAETEDQLNAIAAVTEDLAKGSPMDRLVCGDVGFGKTEVALRAAFITALSGKQVAVIAPTTLLVRQHFKNFTERFKGFPVRIGQLSRMVSTKSMSATRTGMDDGTIDIVVGTHALLSKSTKFRDLGLIIVDEEQHFGVKHKERLKEFRADTHVLTLTATPIPRTLQLAMTGIRDLSLIATPPVDRLAVRTTVGPFDPVVARETLLREHYRGGQSFYVVPRISDLTDVAEFLTAQMPELKFKTAHGQMAAGELEDIMTAFYEGQFDVLVATTIIESGLDIPAANTLIVHKADLFGLAQLYQIRGRVGRSKQRAYAYLTVPARKKLTPGAERRLKVMQSLDTLGAGFTLASHDLDIRGAGNLLGEEQSGHVKEVGVELYQHMLEEAVAELKDGEATSDASWSPQINIGTAVLIPDHYVADLDVRMALYRRLGDLTEQEDLDGFAAELIDRFGPMPSEVSYLMEIVAIKGLCRKAGVAKIDAGPKGAVVSFRNNAFANPAGLVQFIATSPYDVKLRPDQKVVFKQEWPDERARLKGCRRVLSLLLDIAQDTEGAGR
ncbi:MAG: transcription-repair coupling factor [Pseudomonadota bacterium]